MASWSKNEHLCLSTHIWTGGRKTQEHNASGQIYRTGSQSICTLLDKQSRAALTLFEEQDGQVRTAGTHDDNHSQHCDKHASAQHLRTRHQLCVPYTHTHTIRASTQILSRRPVSATSKSVINSNSNKWCSVRDFQNFNIPWTLRNKFCWKIYALDFWQKMVQRIVQFVNYKSTASRIENASTCTHRQMDRSKT